MHYVLIRYSDPWIPQCVTVQQLWSVETYNYNDVIVGAMASQIISLRLFIEPFIQAQIKENIKAPRHWPLCGKFTGDRWIPRTNGQYHGKWFHLMTSSCPPLSCLMYCQAINGHDINYDNLACSSLRGKEFQENPPILLKELYRPIHKITYTTNCNNWFMYIFTSM